MIWWYKDIFIERSSNPQFEHYRVNTKKRTHTMVKAYAKLKSVIQSLVEYQQKRRLNLHSYEALSQLNDYYLADIGLIDEDLYLLRKGKLPARFQHTNVDKIKPVDVRLVSTKAVATEQVDNQLFQPAHFDKAA